MPFKKKRELLFLVIMLVVITGLHYFTAYYRLQLHEFYRRLYYLPIIYGAFKFRFRGGLAVSLIASLVYAPHVVLSVGIWDLTVLNQVMELVLFATIGIITGLLVEQQHRQQSLLTRQLQQLTALENYTENMLASMVTGVAALDTDLRLVRVNRRLTELLGWKTEDQGRSVSELMPGKAQLSQDCQRVLATGRSLGGIETEHQRHPLRVHIMPLYSLVQAVVGLVLVVEDMGDIRELESQVRRSDRLAATGVMAAGIAHEIRNPLGIIKTIVQTLHPQIDADCPGREGLAIIEAEVNRANGVISELMDFARPAPISRAEFDLAAVSEEVSALTARYAAQHGVELKSDILPSLAMHGDREKIKQMLVNLVFNAVQAQPEGGVVKVAVTTDNGEAIIKVADQGQGIDAANRDKIFDPFFTTRDQGTGLGLAIVHRIVQDHDGIIRVASTASGGTEFTISLPKGGERNGNTADY